MATEQTKLIVYVPPAVAEKLEAICKAEDRTMTSVIRRAIFDYLLAATPNPK